MGLDTRALGRMSAVERIERVCVIEPVRGCWNWTGTKDKDGYGSLGFGNKVVRAHRLSHEAFIGPVPTDLLVCHTCDNPSCVNPSHLFVGTVQDNNEDKRQKGRQRGPDPLAQRILLKRIAARGDRNGARTHPERIQRGDAHFFRRHPERILRGEASSGAKLTEEQVRSIRAELASGTRVFMVAKRYGVKHTTIIGIRERRLWKHLP